MMNVIPTNTHAERHPKQIMLCVRLKRKKDKRNIIKTDVPGMGKGRYCITVDMTMSANRMMTTHGAYDDIFLKVFIFPSTSYR
jgi:hypothetical protein